MAPIDMPASGYLGDYLLFWYVLLTLALVTWAFIRRGRRGPARRRRLILGNGLVLLTLLAFVAVLAETYLRFVHDGTDSYGLTLTNRAWLMRHWRTNSWHLRDVEWDLTPTPGTDRVAFLGDSFVAGYGVDDPADRLPDLVRTEFQRRGQESPRVWCFADLNWSTNDQIAFLTEALPRTRPDRIVLGYCLNDLNDLVPLGERFERVDAERPRWINPSQSFLFDFLWFRMRLANASHMGTYFQWVARAHDDAALWGRQRERMGHLGAAARALGAQMDVVVFPFFDTWGEDYPYHAAHERVAAAWREIGVRVLDLREAYAGIPGEELVVNRFDAHPNERAHRIAAEAVLAEFFDAD